ncbi:hypothetical protein [Actinoallomurus oryzae]|uniref:hypothetical protein n=1 Tax=Actinoallomurus oryzae TaxID=502180 RepID=UPI0031EB3A71
MRTARTRTPLLPPTAIGLSPATARARYRLHTVLVAGLLLLSWALYLRLNLSDMESTLRLARAPAYTATVQAPAPETHAPTLVWTDKDGAVRYGTADRDDPYRPGERVRVLEYSTFTCWTWETYDDRRDELIGMVLFLFAVPGAAIVGYLIHRRRRWLGVLRAARSSGTEGRVLGTYRFGHRTGLKVDLGDRTVYVPLMRDQFVDALTSLDALRPVRGGGRFVVFRVAAAGRTVWPGGPYRTRFVPVGAIVRGLLWVGPPLVTLAVHLSTAPISPC